MIENIQGAYKGAGRLAARPAAGTGAFLQSKNRPCFGARHQSREPPRPFICTLDVLALSNKQKPLA